MPERLDPQQSSGPTLGQTVPSSRPTPNLADLILIVEKPARGAEVPPTAYGIPHPESARYPNHLLALIVPDRTGTTETWYYVADRAGQDAYNFAITYAGDNPAYPIYTRTYVLPRIGYEPLPDLTPDPAVPACLLVTEKTAESTGEKELDSLYIKVERVYETLPGPILPSDTYQDERGTVEGAQQSVAATGDEVGSLTRADGFITRTRYEPRAGSEVVLSKFTETWVEVSLNDQRVTSEYGGGVLDVTERTAEPGAQPIDTGFLVVSSRLQTKSPHEQTKVTERLSGASNAYLELTAGGSAYISDPDVIFDLEFGVQAEADPVMATVGMLPEQTVECTFAEQGDANGVFYYLGAHGNNGVWRNPHTAGDILIQSDIPPLGSLAQIVDRAPSNVYMTGSARAYYFDLGAGRSLFCKHLAYRQRSDYGSPTSRFNLQGRNDAEEPLAEGTWVNIDDFEVETKQNKWSQRTVPSTAGYRQFRIINADEWFMIGEFELYGTLLLPADAGHQEIVSFHITNPGASYPPPPAAPPAVTIGGAGVASAQARVNSQGAVAAIDLLAGGSFASPPSVTIAPPGPQITVDTTDHSFVSAGDAHGALYYIGAQQGTEAWSDPTAAGRVQVVASSQTEFDDPPSTLTNREDDDFYTDNVPNSWLGLDLGENRLLTLSAYTLQNGQDPTCTPRNWKLQGSNDVAANTVVAFEAATWADLDVRTADETIAETVAAWGAFTVTGVSTPYRWLRILQTGLTSGDFDYLELSEWEFYGTLAITNDGLPTAIAQVGRAVGSLELMDGGAAYITPPALHFDGETSGTPAAGYAVLGRNLTGIIVTNPGDGYETDPPVTIAGGTSAAAHAVRSFSVASVHITDGGTDWISDPIIKLAENSASPDAATFRAFRGLPLRAVAMISPGAGFTSIPDVEIEGTATGEAVLGFAVASLTLDSPGTDYSSAPDVAIDGDGSGARAHAELLGYSVASIVPTAPGGPYSSPPAVSIMGDGAGAAADAILGFGVDSANVTAGGTGYTSPPGVTITGDGSGAAATCTLTGDAVTAVAITDPGEGYTTATITFDLISGGAGAAATPILNATGAVVGFDITNPGTGYRTPPAVQVSGGAAGSALLSANQAMRLVLDSPGLAYTAVPSVNVSGGGGVSAAATAILATIGLVKRIILTDPGDDYTGPATVTISGGEGGGARASGLRDEAAPGPIALISVINPGRGYLTAPLLGAPEGGGGSGLVAETVLATAGPVDSIVIDDAGFGFTDTPGVSIAAVAGQPRATARAILSLGGSVTSIVLTNPGDGYITTPGVRFISPEGDGAVATALLAASGPVVTLILTSPGGPFFTAPGVTISGGGGDGATAVYHLGDAWPTLVDRIVDPVEGIIIEVTKKVIAYTTVLPPGFAEIKALDRWRSIQIVSRIDPNSLPAPEIYLSSANVAFPPFLLSVSPIWNTSSAFDTHQTPLQATFSQSGIGATGGTGSASVTTEVHGSIVVLKAGGFRGAALARIERSFFKGIPPAGSVPKPTIIRPSSGTASIQGGSANQSSSGSTVPSLLNAQGQPAEVGDTLQDGSILSGMITLSPSSGGGGSVSQSTQIVDINDVLTPGLFYASGYSDTKTADADGAGVLNVSATATGDFSVNIPASCPAAIIPGSLILKDVNIEKWRIDVYVRTLVFVIAPGDCGPFEDASSGGSGGNS